MNINEIIQEEILNLHERQEGIYSIPELAQILGRQGYDEEGQRVITTLLQQAFQENGDQGVVDLYTKLSGVEIDNVSRGRYMFANLVNPNTQQDRFA